jgi:hypothetical protein
MSDTASAAAMTAQPRPAAGGRSVPWCSVPTRGWWDSSNASENASRLAAMQRAEKNIDELLEDLNRIFHRLRQSGIDAELFDVISGFEALAEPRRQGSGQA